MKKWLLLAVLCIGPALLGQTAADKIAAGRAALAAHDLATARTRFAEALDLAPTNQTAAALLGVTRLAALSVDAAANAHLDAAGFSATGRNLYAWTSELPRDASGNPVLPANYNVTQVATFWRDVLDAECERTRANLALVTNRSFLITFTTGETGMPLPITLDYGDVLLSRSILRAIEFTGHFLRGQNLSANLQAINDLANGNILTLRRVFEDNADFLKAGPLAERTAARSAFLDAIGLYRQASAFMHSRPAGVNRLFMIDPADEEDEVQFREFLYQAERSLEQFAEAHGRGGVLVHAAPLFTADFSIRDLFPAWDADGGFDPAALSDSSLGGTFSGLTHDAIVSALDSLGFTPGTGWEWLNPRPQGNTLRGYAHGNGLHLAIGDAGTLLSSTNGTEWTVRRVPGSPRFNAIAFGNGRFVALAWNEAWSSTDGLNWTVARGLFNSYYALAFGGGKFVAIGSYSSTSTDGIHWGDVTFLNRTFSSAVFTGTQFVAVSNEPPGSRIITSSNGTSWTERLATAGVLNAVANGGGRLVAVGDANFLATSSDGTSWTTGTVLPGSMPSTAYASVAWRNGRFVASGATTTGGNSQVTLAGSADGMSWSTLSGTQPGPIVTLSAGPDAFYALGRGGVMLRSTDGISFAVTGGYHNPAAPSTISHFNELREMGGRLYAIGTGGVMLASSDGTNFTRIETGTTATLWSAVHRTGTSLVVGDGGTVLASTDGNTWNARSSGTTASLRTIAFLNNLYVAAGTAGTLLTSSDGVTWTPRVTGLAADYTIQSVAYGNGRFVAIGNRPWASSLVLTSTNGTTWTQPAGLSFVAPRNVVFHDNAFIADGLHRSTDGAIWNQVAIDGEFRELFGLRVLGSRLYAMRGPDRYDPTSVAQVATSSNGDGWYSMPLPTTNAPMAAEIFQGRLYVAGEGNSIFRGGAVPGAIAAPVIVSPPAAVAVSAGAEARFAVAVKGEGTFAFQWRKDGVDIAGARAPVLARANVQAGDVGNYSVLVTGVGGSATSASAPLAVDSATLTLVSDVPVSDLADGRGGQRFYRLTVPAGQTQLVVRLTGGAGDANLYLRRAAAPTTTSYDFRSVALLNEESLIVDQPAAGDWHVLVRANTAYRGATLQAKYLSTVAAPEIVRQPADATVFAGQPVALQVSVSGTGPFTYQWRKNATAIAGATAASFSLPAVGAADVGRYDVVVSNTAGSVTSWGAAVDLLVFPAITVPPATQIVALGQPVTLSVGAVGSGSMTYHWQRVRGGSGFFERTTEVPSLTIPNLTAADAGVYEVTISNSLGTVTSQRFVVGLAGDANTVVVDPTFAAPQFKRRNYPVHAIHDGNGRLLVTGNTIAPVNNQQHQRRDGVLRLSAATGTSVPFSTAPNLSMAWASAVQPDGKVLVAGQTPGDWGTSDETAQVFRVVRYFSDGTLDPNYRSPNFASLGRFITLQPDGKMLFSGGSPLGVRAASGAIPIASLVRLDVNGALDYLFTTPTLQAAVFEATMTAPAVVDSAGRILIGGSFDSVNGVARNRVARLNADGSLDPAFVPSGFSTTATTSIRTMAIQPDGKILVAGGAFRVGASDYALLRLNSDGSLDPTFTLVPSATLGVGARAYMRQQSSGKIVLAGSSVVRLTAEGAVDSSFSVASLSQAVSWFEMMPDDSLVIPTGTPITLNGTAVGSLIRLTRDGALDPAFAPGVFDYEVYPEIASTQPDGKIVVAGAFDQVNGVPHQGIARFLPDGTLDPFYGNPAPAGALQFDVMSAALTRDQRAYAVAFSETVAFQSVVGLHRIGADGRLDTNYSPEPSLALGERRSLRVVVQNDLPVLVDNSAQDVIDGRPLFRRLREDGRIDPSFVGQTTALGRLGLIAGAPYSVIVGSLRVLAQTPDGGFLVSATSGYPAVDSTTGALSGAYSFQLMRFNPDGTTDTGFIGFSIGGIPAGGQTNVIVFDRGSRLFLEGGARYPLRDPFHGATVLADGRIIVTGEFTSIGGVTRQRIARLSASGALDATFSSNAGPTSYRGWSRIDGVCEQPDRKLIVAGNFSFFNNTWTPGGLVRLAPDGALDGGFVTDAAFSEYVRGKWRALPAFGGGVYLLGQFQGPADPWPNALSRLAPPIGAPTVVTPPAHRTVAPGLSTTLSVSATGGGTLSYQWFRNGVPLAGATGSSFTVSSAASADAGSYSVLVGNAAGVVMSNLAVVTVSGFPTNTPGLIASNARLFQGTGTAMVNGAFTVEGPNAKRILIRAVGPTLATYGVTGALSDPSVEIYSVSPFVGVASNDNWGTAWNAAEIPAATAQVGAFPLPAGSRDAVVLGTFVPGTYRVHVIGSSNQTGIVLLEIYDADSAPRMVYAAVRGPTGSGTQSFFPGFVLNPPPQGRTYLVRALGPTLGLPGANPDPRLTIYNSQSAVVASNDNWGGDSTLANLAAMSGAMPLAATSRDAALQLVVPPSSAPSVFTAEVSGVDGAAGVALVEVFEVDGARTGGAAPAIVSPPAPVTVEAGQPFQVGVVATGKPAPTFQWRKNGTMIGGAMQSLFVADLARPSDAGDYDVVITNTAGTTTSFPATVTVSPPSANGARHALVESGYLPGSTVTITNTLVYTGTPGGLGWSVTLPAGWRFASDGGAAGDIKPVAGATGTLTWSWTTVPANPVVFSYTLRVPDTESTTETLTATATVQAGGTPATVSPASLTLARLIHHSCDTNRDLHIDLLELTRVIELYNTRNGTVRTGCYAVATTMTTEDGFVPEPARPAGAGVTLSRYHSADYSADGRLSLLELTRVIELYNYREGTVRTGRYRRSQGTEDGFAPGPQDSSPATP